MSRFYFTFGQAYNLRDNYVVVEAKTRREAIAKFVEARTYLDEMQGWLYAFDYSEAGFAGQIEEYGLTEVPITASIWRER